MIYTSDYEYDTPENKSNNIFLLFFLILPYITMALLPIILPIIETYLNTKLHSLNLVESYAMYPVTFIITYLFFFAFLPFMIGNYLSDESTKFSYFIVSVSYIVLFLYIFDTLFGREAFNFTLLVCILFGSAGFFYETLINKVFLGIYRRLKRIARILSRKEKHPPEYYIVLFILLFLLKGLVLSLSFFFTYSSYFLGLNYDNIWIALLNPSSQIVLIILIPIGLVVGYLIFGTMYVFFS